LVFKAAVADFTQPVEEHRPRQGIFGLSLVQPNLHAAAQLNILQLVQSE
jgi:hypothetical protein